MNDSTALIPRTTVTQIVAARDEAVRLYEEYFADLEEAQKKLARAEGLIRATIGTAGWPYASRHQTEIAEFMNAIKAPDVSEHQRLARRLLDIRFWAGIVEMTQLEALMDRTAKDELREQMQFVPERVDPSTGQLLNQAEIAKALPPVSEEAVLATLDGFRERSGEIWQRGIAVAFSSLDRRFRSHDGFKLGSRVILTRAFDEWGGWNYYRSERDTLLDIERVFLVLDGKLRNRANGEEEGDGERATYASIVGLIEQERRGGGLRRRQSEHEGDYFRVRVFKNGNAHLWFTRPDLVEQVNQILADYYGAGLGWGKAPRDEDPEQPFSDAVERAPARGLGFFPTPDDLADRVIEAAWLTKGRMRVLEPSAGTGQLSRRAVSAADPLLAHWVDVVEVDPERAADLRRSDLYERVYARDFLSMEPDRCYQRVIMNPPFDRHRDVDHVHHALKFLVPGGRLVAIMSASAEFSEAPRAVAFRKELERHKHKWTDLPAGSFREVGTNVNAVMLTVDTKETS